MLRTMVDGQIRQWERVSDLLFDCGYLVAYLSTGTTLRKGSVIMAGTPAGRYCLVISVCLSVCLSDDMLMMSEELGLD